MEVQKIYILGLSNNFGPIQMKMKRSHRGQQYRPKILICILKPCIV